MRHVRGFRLVSAFLTSCVVALLVTLSWVRDAASEPPNFAGPPPDYFIDESKLPFDALPGTVTTRYWGIHNKAGYRIEVPANWNGELVMFAHGARNLGLPLNELTVDFPGRLRNYFVANGYAWAASSFSKNLYDVREGVSDTHALTEFFNGLVGKPTRTYVFGPSMGGHIAAAALEQYPQTYHGALLTCGVLADNEALDFYLDFHLVAQTLSGLQPQFPEPENYQTDVVPLMRSALGNPFPIVLTAAGEELRAVTERLSGGPRPFFPLAFRFWGDFLLARGYGDGTRLVAVANASTNVDTVYQSDDDPALSASEQELNETILRVAETPQGRHPNGLANIPRINGTTNVPVMAVHTIGDLQVPFSMEQIYARRIAANGRSDLLVSRAVRDLGHCGFMTSEVEEAFRDLVDWGRTGAKPDGDNILDPTVVAAPDFGCKFTRVRRAALPACPTP